MEPLDFAHMAVTKSRCEGSGAKSKGVCGILTPQRWPEERGQDSMGAIRRTSFGSVLTALSLPEWAPMESKVERALVPQPKHGLLLSCAAYRRENDF